MTFQSTIKQVLENHARRLLELDGVVGVAEGLDNGQPCVKVYISQRTDSSIDSVPTVLEGYQVLVEQVGQIKSLD